MYFMYLICFQGPIIDVNLTATLLEDDGLVAVHTVPAGGLVGVVYTRHLVSIVGTAEIAQIGVNTI
jgi:predicted ATP-grasp superfamily ATP-dependent carboligase